jgi:hypothetical protein
MSYFRGSEYNAVKKEHGGDRRGRKASGQSDQLKTTGTRIAEKYGVSDKTVRRDAVFAQVIDKIVEEYGDAEIKRNLLGADVRMSQGAARLLLKMPAKDRKAAVDQLVEQGELPRAKKGMAPVRKPKEIAQDLVKRLQAKSEAHAKSVLQQMAKLLGMEVVDKKQGE